MDRHVESVTPDATPEETAAAIAAVEQFLRDDVALTVEDPGPRLSAWQRAALREGINRAPDSPPFWV